MGRVLSWSKKREKGRQRPNYELTKKAHGQSLKNKGFWKRLKEKSLRQRLESQCVRAIVPKDGKKAGRRQRMNLAESVEIQVVVPTKKPKTLEVGR
ncbi:MAG: hypothetical protein IJT59_06160 [Desulfovibrionaceae bacterium]|nr:hypothetical protein [Desulfovibrionaceae bacterium]